MEKRKEKTSGARKRWLTPKELWERLLNMTVGDCLPWIAACILLCSIATGYAVLWLEQKEQYQRDTFDVYLQEYGERAAAAAAAAGPSKAAQADETPAAAAVPDKEQTPEQGSSETQQEPSDTPPQAEHVYASPSGKRYHYDAVCPGKNGQEITWDEVERRGLTPCRKCAS